MEAISDTIFISKAIKILRSGPMAGRWSLRLNGKMPPVLEVSRGTDFAGSVFVGKKGYEHYSTEGELVNHFDNLEEAIMAIDLQVLMSLMWGMSPDKQPILIAEVGNNTRF